MNLTVWILAITLMVGLLIKSIDFHRSTICRQKAWALSLELRTHELLEAYEGTERKFLPDCKIQVSRNNKKVWWRSLKKSYEFTLELDGKL